MSTQPINHVMISVTDLDASIKFYEAAAGMTVALRTELSGTGMERMMRAPEGLTGSMVLMRGGNKAGQVELIQFNPPPERVTGLDLLTPGHPMLSFEADSTEDLLEKHHRLTELGYEVWSEPQKFSIPGYGIMHVFMVSDPDGTCVEIVRLPTREEVKAFLASETSGDAK